MLAFSQGIYFNMVFKTSLWNSWAGQGSWQVDSFRGLMKKLQTWIKVFCNGLDTHTNNVRVMECPELEGSHN